MERLDYNAIILEKVEGDVDRILPIASLLSFLSAVAVYFSAIPFRFVIFDFAISILFFVLYLNRRRVSSENKILIIVIVAITIGTLSFLDGGFASAGLTLIMISNAVAILLMYSKKSLVISFLTSALFLMLWMLSLAGVIIGRLHLGITLWFIQYFTYILYLLFLHIAARAIRNYLIDVIEQLGKSVKRTHSLAYFDQLTGLPNQIMFKREVNKRLKDGAGSGYLVLIHLKNLRVINTVYSNRFGDKVLKKTAEILTLILSSDDYVARVSGSEFAFWIDHNIERPIEDELTDLKTLFYEKFELEDMKKEVEHYNAYVLVTEEDGGIAVGYQRAVMALTYAKKYRTSAFITYNASLEEVIVSEERMFEELKTAIQKDEFIIYYQFKKNAVTNTITGVEALARWQHPKRGLVSPGIFIPKIEELGMSIAFGKLIIVKVLEDYKELCSKYGDDITVSINISPTHLVSAGFVDFVEQAIQLSGIRSNRIVFEITEDVIIQGIDVVEKIIVALRSSGFKVSLDDFGTGYSSLNYLMHLAIDELKIDKSFVDLICSNEKTQIILGMIIEMTREYNLGLTAEGVETKEQCDRLVAMGCNIIQGYYFSKPEPLK